MARGLAASFYVLAICALAAPSPGATVYTNWIGGNSVWNDANNWDNGVANANNGSGNQYVVSINSSANNPVLLDGNVAIGWLWLGTHNPNTLAITNGSCLFLDLTTADGGASVANSGAITLNSTGAATRLVFHTAGESNTIMLNGAGSILLSNNAGNIITQDGLRAQMTLENTNLQVIGGAGQLGAGTLGLINVGMIYGTSAGLVISTGLQSVVNTGTIYTYGDGNAATGGVVRIQGASINNTGGSLLANHAGAVMYLEANTLTGGYVAVSNGGTMHIKTAMSGETVSVQNTGTMVLEANGVVGGNITIDAGGTLQLDGGAVTGGTVGNSGTIELLALGTGSLDGFFNNLAGGQINVGTGAKLELLTGGSYGNAGVINLTDGGGLLVRNNAGHTVAPTNPNGRIYLNGTGGTFEIADGTFSQGENTIDGNGGLTKTGAGTMLIVSANGNHYAGPTIVSGGTLVTGSALALPATTRALINGGTLDIRNYAHSITALTISDGYLDLGVGNLLTTTDPNAGATTLGGTLNVFGPVSASVGKYKLIQAASPITGTFTAGSLPSPDSNLPSPFVLKVNGDELDLQQPARQNFNALSPAATVSSFMNQSISASGMMANPAPAGSSSLAVSLGSTGDLTVDGISCTASTVVMAGDSNRVTGTIHTGTVVGAQTWAITNTDPAASPAVSAMGGTVAVMYHGTPTLPASVALGRVMQNAGAGHSVSGAFTVSDGTVGFTDPNTAGIIWTAGAVTGDSAIGSTGANTARVVGCGDGNSYDATLNTATTGTYGGSQTFTFADDGNVVGHGGLGSLTVQISGTVVANRGITTTSVNFGRTMVGQAVSGSATLSTTGDDGNFTRLTVGGPTNDSGGNGMTADGNSVLLNSTMTVGRSVAGAFATSGIKNGTVSMTVTGEGLDGERDAAAAIAYSATALNDRSIFTTPVVFSRVMVNTPVFQWISLTTAGDDSNFTRLTVANTTGADLNGIAVTDANGGHFNSASSVAYRQVGGAFSTTGTQSGLLILGTSGEGLAGEVDPNVAIAYSATAVDNRVVTATDVIFSNVLKGAKVSGISNLSTFGDADHFTDANIALGSSADGNGFQVTVGGSAGTLFNSAGSTGVRTVTGVLSSYGNLAGSLVLTNGGEGLAGEAPINVHVAYSAANVGLAKTNGTSFGTTLTASLNAGDTYAGLASKTIRGGYEGGSSQMVLGTEAMILDGIAGRATTLGMQWRTRLSGEVFPGDDSLLDSNIYSPTMPLGSRGMISDVVNITGTGTDLIAIQMSFDSSLIQPGDETKRSLAPYATWEDYYIAHGWIYLAWFDEGQDLWVRAAGLGLPGTYKGNAAYDSATDFVLGDWGVDEATSTVWAVVNHGGQFAVIPEPTALMLLGLGGLALLRRKRRAAI